MADVFISYKQEERERMRPIADGLRELGVEVWFDERLQPDRSFTEEIQHVIEHCRAQLVCWSPAAVRSEWVRGEAEKGRQRGLLIAALIEPCELPPPFNMHHAESLAGWTGDPRHLGWRKVCEAIGRKLERPGLGELAALQGAIDPAAWKKWAQKYPSDPSAEAAWAKAEELEIGATRDRMGREREAAKRTAEEAERKRAAQTAAPAAPPTSAPVQHAAARRGPNIALIGAGALAVAVLGAGGYFAWTQQQRGAVPSEAAGVTEQERRIAELEARLAALDQAPAGADLSAEQQQRISELETEIAAARQAAPPPRETAPTRPNAPATQAPTDPAAAAIAALDRISAREWATGSSRVLLPRVLAASSRASLEAAARSDARAQALVGSGYFYGMGGYTQSDAEALRFWRLAASQGHPWGQRNLGFMYENGRGLTADRAEAVRLYRLAADQGLANAQSDLGFMYREGRGVPRDDAEAVRLYRLAADQGNAIAQRSLGDMYRDGLGVARDDAEAVRLYRLAADQGNASAQTHLGWMYEYGRGLTADRAEAVRLYRLAARQGYETAQQYLTRLGETW